MHVDFKRADWQNLPFVGVVDWDIPLERHVPSTPRELRDLVTPTSRSAIHR
jgi:hypothetical protein